MQKLYLENEQCIWRYSGRTHLSIRQMRTDASRRLPPTLIPTTPCSKPAITSRLPIRNVSGVPLSYVLRTVSPRLNLQMKCTVTVLPRIASVPVPATISSASTPLILAIVVVNAL
jgi:hypothetical protein